MGCRRITVFFFFLFFFFIIHAIPSAVSVSCHLNESSKLLQFKQRLNLKPDKLNSWQNGSDCCDWEGVGCNNTVGFVTSLQLSGVTKSQIDNNTTRSVSAALFRLQHLQILNLSYNDFGRQFPRGLSELKILDFSHCHFSGQVPLEITKMTQLVSLNLSFVSFNGSRLQLQQPSFRELVKGLSNLVDLRLDWVNVSTSGRDVVMALSSSLPRLKTLTMSDSEICGPIDKPYVGLSSLCYLDLSHNNLSYVSSFFVNLTSLVVLKLTECSLEGDFPSDIFLLPQIEELDISHNEWLHVKIPIDIAKSRSIKDLELSATKHISSNLDALSTLTQLSHLGLSSSGIDGNLPLSWQALGISVLDLSNNSIRGGIPEYFNSFSNLSYLNLANNQLNGMIPSRLLTLPCLEVLSLQHNLLSGEIPIPTASVSSSLRYLHLNNFLSGNIPSNLYSLSSLHKLDLRNNSLSGFISSDLFRNHSFLMTLHLGNNQFCGEISPRFFLNLPSVMKIDLSHNQLNGSIPSPLPSFPNLNRLYLSFNKFSGSLPKFSRPLVNLKFLFLEMNFLSGSITFSARELPNLLGLDLSHNDFSGTINISLFSGMNNLFYLDLSDNTRLTWDTSNASSIYQSNINNPPIKYLYLRNCGIKAFPSFIQALPGRLQILDLSLNDLSGRIPSWIWRTLDGFSISYCNIQGFDKPSNIIDSSIKYLNVSHNRISGPLPSFICNFRALQILDMSYNELTGDVPNCFYDSLVMIHLNSNSFTGKIPRSLSSHSELQALDLGNNKLNDTFPFWLGSLTKLHILILRSNHLWGTISLQGTEQAFPSLQILDISGNLFSGSLPTQLVKSLEAMKVIQPTNANTFIRKNVSYDHSFFIDTDYVSVTQTIKGKNVVIVKVIGTLCIVDLSKNLFTGYIPQELGALQGLHELNISSNNLKSVVPKSLGNLKQLESLDLSNNHLFGEIPNELSLLTFLEILNLSFNDLQGSIPQGKQFGTFDKFSFEGNPKLCGPQVNKLCSFGRDEDGTHDNVFSDEENNQEEEWRYGAIGIGFAVGLGMLSLPLLFIKRVKIWYWDQIDKLIMLIFHH